MGAPDSEKPTTLEELRALKRRFDRTGNWLVGLYLPVVLFLLVVCPVLVFTIPENRVPWLLRPLWDPVTLILLLGLAFTLVVRFSPLGRRTIPLLPLSRAVNAFFMADSSLKKWERTGKTKFLRRSHKMLSLCGDHLEAVPEFQDLKSKIEDAIRMK
jgi:hypothetical protein